MKTTNLSLQRTVLFFLFCFASILHFSCKKVFREDTLSSAKSSFSMLSTPGFVTITNNQRWSGVDVIRLDNGTLLAALGTDYNNSDTNNFKSIYLTTSVNGGLSWSTPYNSGIPATAGYRYLTPTLLKKGSRIFMCIQNVSNAGYIATDEGDNPFVSYSDNNGTTWTTPVTMLSTPDHDEYVIVTGRNHTVTNSGRIIIPVSHGQHDLPYSYGYIYSDNNGTTWDELTKTSVDDCDKFAEPTIAQLNDGRLISLIRTDHNRIYKSFSSNDGNTWTTPVATSLHSPWTAHTIAVSPEGYLLAVYMNWTDNNACDPVNPRGGPRHNLTFTVSYDYGDTWTDEQEFIGPPTIASNDVVMSPCVTFMDNKIFVAFYNEDVSATSYELQGGLFNKSDIFTSIADYINEDWNSLGTWFLWGSGTRQISSNTLRLSDNSGTITSAYKYQKLATRYTLDFRTRVQSFVTPVNINNWTTLGTTYSDGQYRLMIKFESDGIYVADQGVWTKYDPAAYTSALTSWHTWQVTVDNGDAKLYMDGNPVAVAHFTLEETPYFTGRIGHWTSCGNSSTTEAFVDYSYFTPDIDESIYEHWLDQGNWSLTGSGTNEIIDETLLHMTDNSNSITSVYRNPNGANRYTLKFRAKVNQFVNSGYVSQYSTLGASFSDGTYRSLFKLETDGVYLANRSDVYINIYNGASYLNNKTGWHIWTIEVNDGVADVYMDGQLIEDDFEIQLDNSGPKLQHWTSSISTMPTDVLIDYTYLIYR